MRLFLVRHGNTFGPDQAGGEHIIMSGCHNNIPLVEKGREQARAMASYLHQQNKIPSAFYANHLIRTWEAAVLMREYFYYQLEQMIPLYVDENLLELDYGAWAGLGSAGKSAEDNEVIARFGQQAWDDWQEKRLVPQGAPHHWQRGGDEMVASLRLFLGVLTEQYDQNQTIVAMGSQGSLVFIHELLPGGLAQAIANQQIHIKTGNFAELAYENNAWRLVQWNVKPSLLQSA